jgi:hypothetical protein
VEFPHSDISGSKVAWHLPEAYRRHAASFIANHCQGIHHTPLLVSSLALTRQGRRLKDRNNLLSNIAPTLGASLQFLIDFTADFSVGPPTLCQGCSIYISQKDPHWK